MIIFPYIIFLKWLCDYSCLVMLTKRLNLVNICICLAKWVAHSKQFDIFAVILHQPIILPKNRLVKRGKCVFYSLHSITHHNIEFFFAGLTLHMVVFEMWFKVILILVSLILFLESQYRNNVTSFKRFYTMYLGRTELDNIYVSTN